MSIDFELVNLDELTIMWKKHALQRMMERSILRAEVLSTIENGVIIESYKDDYPYPSFLVAYIESEKPLHVVFSIDAEANMLYIITAYEPNSNHFKDDLITRK